VTEPQTSRALDRDVFWLLVLAAIAIGLFFLTRNIAAKDRQLEIHTAATWYAKGEQQVDSGLTEKAIDSFRKAVANDRENQKYAFALARALAAGNHDLEAAQTVLRLREADPEDAQINLVLAGLASKRADLTEAIHYYENAIYGRWTGNQVDKRRRRARIELIQLLLSHQQFDRALSELLTLDGDLPDSAESHVQAGQLFLQANDPQHALKDFEIALKLDSHDPAALAGAGDAYFELGNYSKARHYLETAVGQGNESGDVQEKLSLVKLIFSLDPLGPKLSARERQQRLKAGYQQAMQRLQTCMGQRLTNEQTTNLQNLATEAVSTQPQFQLRNIERDPDVVRSGLETIYRIETATNAACGKAPESDQALLLIASRHDGRQ